MTERTVRHEVKLQRSVIVILGLLALGVCANAFSSVFSVSEVSAGHVGHTNLGSINHPIQIVCQKGC
jgi:hypothetical protein